MVKIHPFFNVVRMKVVYVFRGEYRYTYLKCYRFIKII